MKMRHSGGWLSSRGESERLENQYYSKNDIYFMLDHSSSIPFGGRRIIELFSIETPFSLYVFVHWNHKIV